MNDYNCETYEDFKSMWYFWNIYYFTEEIETSIAWKNSW